MNRPISISSRPWLTLKWALASKRTGRYSGHVWTYGITLLCTKQWHRHSTYLFLCTFEALLLYAFEMQICNSQNKPSQTRIYLKKVYWKKTLFYYTGYRKRQKRKQLGILFTQCYIVIGQHKIAILGCYSPPPPPQGYHKLRTVWCVLRGHCVLWLCITRILQVTHVEVKQVDVNAQNNNNTIRTISLNRGYRHMFWWMIDVILLSLSFQR